MGLFARKLDCCILITKPQASLCIGVAPIMQLRTCVMKIVHIQGRSPNVVKVIFHTIRNYSKRKEFAPPLREVPIFKRDAIKENLGFIAALWSPEGKGLTSWLLFVVFILILLLSHLVFWDRCCT